ncbi:MAG: hypothetical protein EPO39_01155 [Candidatus Manganitrophaceae bacterium]|nr:MAG: hypothetical protein EPO39_01155 [Candidatus Manganitrophaceae bacterium]
MGKEGKKDRACQLIALMFTTLLLMTVAIAPALQAEAPNAAVDPGRPADSRVPLNLPPAVREVMDQTMREHLEALQKILAAMAGGKYDEAASLAHEELGFPKHHQVMQREQGAVFPKRYQEMAMDHHRKAEDLAKALSSKEMNKILPALDQTIIGCVNCHRVFKQ